MLHPACAGHLLHSRGDYQQSPRTTRGGIPAGTLSIPCLYVHSPVETVSLRDMEQSVALLKAYVEGLE